MRRTGGLIDLICTRDNFRIAWMKSIRGRRTRSDILSFREHLDDNLDELCEALREGRFHFGDYESFTIRDPKERVITAASFPERVVHLAVMNVLEPVFERRQIFDSYACRPGKGSEAAVLRTFHFAKSHPSFLKLDVRKYFDSIDHTILMSQLSRIIKDDGVSRILGDIVESYCRSPGKGLPIGNLTSQYFANHYLSPLDHEVLDRLRLGPWIRYMDDVICLGRAKDDMARLYNQVSGFAKLNLQLSLKPKILDSCDAGIPFLGFLIKPWGIYPLKKTKRRFVRTYRRLLHEFESDAIGEEEFAFRAGSVCSHLELARSRRFMQNVVHGRVLGRQPGESRRELEQ